MSVRARPWDVVVATLSFAGIVYLFLSMREPPLSAPASYVNGFLVCGLLWLPGLILLLVRIGRQPPFIGETL